MSNSKPPAFETTLTELTKIVESMEVGTLPLEKALQEFERGVKLTRECQAAITNAEQRVAILMDDSLQSFDHYDNSHEN